MKIDTGKQFAALLVCQRSQPDLTAHHQLRLCPEEPHHLRDGITIVTAADTAGACSRWWRPRRYRATLTALRHGATSDFLPPVCRSLSSDSSSFTHRNHIPSVVKLTGQSSLTALRSRIDRPHRRQRLNRRSSCRRAGECRDLVRQLPNIFGGPAAETTTDLPITPTYVGH